MKEILFFKDYLTERFGRPLYRVPIDLGLSCPHRDANAQGGCTFCPENGARAIHLQSRLKLDEQVHKGVAYVHKRYGMECGLIAYFQSFTNTYGDIELLEKHYRQVLDSADFSMVIIATRPDCLGDEVLNLLNRLNREYELWIELGVQTANNTTLKRINRGHSFADVEAAVRRLDQCHIKTTAHVILGLPGETLADYLETAEKLAALPFSGIKVHNLLVLKNTVLANEFRDKPFECLNEYEYAHALVRFLQCLPDDWPVMRINADADVKEIIAPRWWMKKGQFIEYVTNSMRELAESGVHRQVPRVKTADGSYTFYHPEFKQHFHTLAGARSEAWQKFIEPSGVEERLQRQKQVQVLDIGFGLGYNAIAACQVAEQKQQGRVDIVTLEYDLQTLKIALGVYEYDSLEYQIVSELIENGEWRGAFSAIRLLCGDARQSVKQLKTEASAAVDLVFLDAFSPDANPELWTYDFLLQVKSLMDDDGLIVTYSSAYPVRGALCRCRFIVGETNPFGRKRGGTIAAINQKWIKQPLSEKVRGVVAQSTSGVVYRDCSLDWSRKKILEFRRKLVTRLRKRGVPKWYNG